jgi:hypothetical protein
MPTGRTAWQWSAVIAATSAFAWAPAPAPGDISSSGACALLAMLAAAVTSDLLAAFATSADGAADSSSRAMALVMCACDPARTEVAELGWRLRTGAPPADLDAGVIVRRAAAITDAAASTTAPAVHTARRGIRTRPGRALSAWLP